MTVSAVLDEMSGLRKGSKFSESRSSALSGKPNRILAMSDVRRQLGTAEQTVYTWKKKYAHLGLSDLSLVKYMLSEAFRKKSEARALPGIGTMVSWDISDELCGGLSPSPVWPRVVVLEESGEESDYPEAADS